MTSIHLAIIYLVWHYTMAFSDIFNIWGRFFWFFWRFFSISSLFRTLLFPWRRLNEEYSSGFVGWLSLLVVNTIMRIVGFIMRILLILIGLISLIFVFIFGVIVLIIWIFLPPVAVGALFVGLALIFT